MVSLTLFVVYATSSVVGLLLMKRSFLGQPADVGISNAIELLSWQLSAGVALYVASFLIWLRILATHPLSSSFPVAVGLTVVGTLVVGSLALNETVGAIKIMGVALVVAGIIAIGTG